MPDYDDEEVIIEKAIPSDIKNNTPDNHDDAYRWACKDSWAECNRLKKKVKVIYSNYNDGSGKGMEIRRIPSMVDYAPKVTEKAAAPAKVDDPQTFAREKAAARAEETGATVTVEITDDKGKVVGNATESPTEREKGIPDKAKGDKSPEKPAASERSEISARSNAQSNTGSIDAADEGEGKSSPGNPKGQLADVLNNVPRVLGGVVPSLEGLMMNIPQASLGKFTSLLPPAFKSLLPVGSIAGLVSKGAVSMSGLTNLVAGAALGQVAGQALRSIAGGPSAISGLTGALGAQSISRITGSAIPVNIASTFGNAILSNAAGSIAGKAFGSSPQSAAVIANVVGVVTNVALNKRSGVPVSSQVLGLAANVALKSAGVRTSVPTSILGLASSSAMNPLASLIGSSVSARIPVLPGNLSLPNMGALSGLTQNIGPGLAENLIPPNQLQGLLPGNLQAQIPAIPPRVSGGNPYVKNDVAVRRDASPESSGPIKGDTTVDKKDPLVTSGKGGPNGDYTLKISEHYTLSDFCITPTQSPKRYIYAYPAGNCTVDQIIENLSWLAVNIVEPIRSRWPGFTLNSGYDYPKVSGSNRTGGSKHFYGQAMDLQWQGDMYNWAKQQERGKWIMENLPVRACLLEWAGNAVWIHVDGSKNNPYKFCQTYKHHVKFGQAGQFDNPMPGNSRLA